MLENKSAPIATIGVFAKRVFVSVTLATLVIVVSLAFGAWGYHVFGEMPWIDALLNAAMILTGMGPVDPMKSVGGKLFATAYCLFSGIIFLTSMAIILAPIYHRFLHTFHLPDEDDGDDRK